MTVATPTPLLALSCVAALTACTHAATGTDHRMHGARIQGACEAPASANVGRAGCYFDQTIELGALIGPAFYHVDEFTDVAAAEGAVTDGSAIVRAYDRVFLETVNTDAQWRPRGGHRLAMAGPMPVHQGVPVTARFMQATTPPGATTRPHRHNGPEAFYVIDGALCMETLDGIAHTSAGNTYWVRGDMPMQLTSAGNQVRRSLFVVLHATAQPWMTVAPDWTPTGACVTPAPRPLPAAAATTPQVPPDR